MTVEVFSIQKPVYYRSSTISHYPEIRAPQVRTVPMELPEFPDSETDYFKSKSK